MLNGRLHMEMWNGFMRRNEEPTFLGWWTMSQLAENAWNLRLCHTCVPCWNCVTGLAGDMQACIIHTQGEHSTTNAGVCFMQLVSLTLRTANR